MIEYTEKGAGLHAAIAAAGHWLAQVDGIWKSSDDAAVQAIIDGYTLDDAKSLKSREVSLRAKALRDRATELIAAGEMASWPIKRAEADAFTSSGDAASCPELAREAAQRGIPLADLVVKVQANAARFLALETAVGGIDGKHRDAIWAAADFATLAAYDYSTGWPGF